MINLRILTTCFLIFCFQLISCQKESYPPTDIEILGKIVKPEFNDEYIYPILPGTPEWKQFESHDEMVEAVRIPDAILQKISTWGLIESCFKYPLRGDNMFMNCPSDWINSLSISNGGLHELFSRPDVSKILLYNYRYLDSNKVPDLFDWRYIELIVGCDAFISKLNERQLLYLVAVAIKKSQEQRAYANSSFPPNSLYIMGNAMTHAGYKPFIDYCILQKTLIEGKFKYWPISNDLMKIEEYAKEFIRN